MGPLRQLICLLKWLISLDGELLYGVQCHIMSYVLFSDL